MRFERPFVFGASLFEAYEVIFANQSTNIKKGFSV